MRNNFKSLLSLLLIATLGLTIAGCSKEEPFGPETENNGTGELSLKKMLLEVTNEENIVRSEINYDNFNIIIRDSQGQDIQNYRYADMPDVIKLPVGLYTVYVNSGNDVDADWEAPYFEGTSKQFKISKDDIIEVETIVCKLANVRVTIKYDEALIAKMGSDCKVNVLVGNKGSLDFVSTETRSGYFRYIPGSTTLVATFSGTVDGNSESNNILTKTDVAPGNHYIITYTLKGITGNIPDIEGGINPGINVDSAIKTVNLTIDISSSDDYIDDTDRPGENGGDDPEPNPSTPTVSVDEPLNINNKNVVKDGDQVIIRASSNSNNGFTEFKVRIVSEILDPATLQSVGLASVLDLINPGEFEEKLNDLGFPTKDNVKGKKSFQADISPFIGMLSILGPGEHGFELTVSDANGKTVKTLTLVIE